jgi:hypothetical protein
VSHLFHTLVVTLRILVYTYKLQPGGAEIARLRCADLEPWTLTSRSAFVVATDLARQTGTVQRALAWRRLVHDMQPTIRAEHVDSVPYGLRFSSSTALRHLGRRLVLTRPPNTAGPRWRVLRAAPRRRSTNRHI